MSWSWPGLSHFVGGGSGGKYTTYIFPRCVSQVILRAGRYLDGIMFQGDWISSWSRESSPWFGGSGGWMYYLNAPYGRCLGDIQMRSGRYIDQICINFNAYRCIPCQNGYYAYTKCTTDGTRGNICSKCRTCGTNQYEYSKCSEAGNTLCRNCDKCGTGQYISAECSGSRNTVCSTCRTCNTGEYVLSECSGTMNTVCSTCTTCNTGEYALSECSGMMNTVCSTCDTCDLEDYIVKPCSESQNTECLKPVRSASEIYNSIIAATNWLNENDVVLSTFILNSDIKYNKFLEWADKFHRGDDSVKESFDTWLENSIIVELNNHLYNNGVVSMLYSLNEFSNLNLNEFYSTRGFSLNGYQIGFKDWMSQEELKLKTEQNFRRRESIWWNYSLHLSEEEMRRIYIPDVWTPRPNKIRDQKEGATCWAFAAAAAMESSWLVRKSSEPKIEIDVQWLIDCLAYTHAGTNPQSQGGWPSNIYEWAVNGGIKKTWSYYRNGYFNKAHCDESLREPATATKPPNGWKIPLTDDELKKYIHLLGACTVSVYTESNNTAFLHYAGKQTIGKYVSNSTQPGLSAITNVSSNYMHAITLIGYTEQYWIAQNSWGETWGDGGLMYLDRNVFTLSGTLAFMVYPYCPIFLGTTESPTKSPTPSPTEAPTQSPTKTPTQAPIPTEDRGRSYDDGSLKSDDSVAFKFKPPVSSDEEDDEHEPILKFCIFESLCAAFVSIASWSPGMWGCMLARFAVGVEAGAVCAPESAVCGPAVEVCEIACTGVCVSLYESLLGNACIDAVNRGVPINYQNICQNIISKKVAGFGCVEIPNPFS